MKTVKQLIEWLQNFPEYLQVYTEGDSLFVGRWDGDEPWGGTHEFYTEAPEPTQEQVISRKLELLGDDTRLMEVRLAKLEKMTDEHFHAACPQMTRARMMELTRHGIEQNRKRYERVLEALEDYH